MNDTRTVRDYYGADAWKHCQTFLASDQKNEIAGSEYIDGKCYELLRDLEKTLKLSYSLELEAIEKENGGSFAKFTIWTLMELIAMQINAMPLAAKGNFNTPLYVLEIMLAA